MDEDLPKMMQFTTDRDSGPADMDTLAALAQEIEDLVKIAAPHIDVEHKLFDFLAIAHYDALGVFLDHCNTWHRGRRQAPSQIILPNLRNFIYPPDPGPDFGRMNFPHQPVFYASWNRPTVLAELSPIVGDTVWFIETRPKSNSSVIATLVGAYEYFYRSGRLLYPSKGIENYLCSFFATASHSERIRTIFIDAFLARLLRNPSPNVYPATSAFAQRIYSANQPTAILYPSVKTFASINLAVPQTVFDAYFEVMLAATAKVEGAYGYELFDLALNHLPCTSFHNDGTISWTAEAQTFPSFSFRGGFSYPPEARGWSSLIEH